MISARKAGGRERSVRGLAVRAVLGQPLQRLGDEIADILEISLGTVKSRITRGRDAMRRQLEGRLQPETELQWDAAAG